MQMQRSARCSRSAGDGGADGGGPGWLVCVALCVMLAATYSRTGMLVLVCEIVALLLDRKTLSSEMVGRVETGRTSARSTRSTRLNIMQGRGGLATAVVAVAIAAWWMWPRLALDGAILNRPKIWLAGLKLFAANPLGVGFGKSGEIATAFMLPEGTEVRTLVNSHLTLLAEMGAFVGGAWLAFIALALGAGRAMRRTWVAFAGLAVSAFRRRCLIGMYCLILRRWVGLEWSTSSWRGGCSSRLSSWGRVACGGVCF